MVCYKSRKSEAQKMFAVPVSYLPYLDVSTYSDNRTSFIYFHVIHHTINSYVRYCSKECQRLAWPTHRRSCKVTSAMQAEADSDDVATVVSKWLPSWRHTLFSFGINAMNLANSPRNQLGTHVYAIQTS